MDRTLRLPAEGAHGKGVSDVTRIVGAVLAGLMTFGLVFGLAASLNLTSDGLGSATTVVAACQSGTLNATYTSTYTAAAPGPGYTVGTVTISGLASTCYTKP